MNEKEIEKRIREAIQGVWVLESKKMSDGRIVKPPQISAVSIYSHRHIVNHWVMEDGGYASTFQEYSVSGSKVIVIDISAISNKPLWGAEPKAKVHDRSERQNTVEARIQDDKIYIGNVFFDRDECVGGDLGKEGFELVYRRVEILQ